MADAIFAALVGAAVYALGALMGVAEDVAAWAAFTAAGFAWVDSGLSS
jgi:hypothetical protein